MYTKYTVAVNCSSVAFIPYEPFLFFPTIPLLVCQFVFKKASIFITIHSDCKEINHLPLLLHCFAHFFHLWVKRFCRILNILERKSYLCVSNINSL